jgi:hypothetical protein
MLRCRVAVVVECPSAGLHSPAAIPDKRRQIVSPMLPRCATSATSIHDEQTLGGRSRDAEQGMCLFSSVCFLAVWDACGLTKKSGSACTASRTMEGPGISR